MQIPWNDQEYINIAFAYREYLEAWRHGHQRQYPSASVIVREIRDEYTKAMLEAKMIFGYFATVISTGDQHKSIVFDTHLIIDPKYDTKAFPNYTDLVTYKSYFVQGTKFDFQRSMYSSQPEREEFVSWVRHDRIVAVRPMPYSWGVELLVHPEESVRIVGQYVAKQQPLIEKFWPQGKANVQ